MTTKKVAKDNSVNDVSFVTITFPKKKIQIDVGDDLGLSEYQGVKFSMWADPSVRTIARILSPLSKEEGDLTEADGDAYFDALNQIILETNIEGISFDTLEDTIEAYDHPHLPYGFIGLVASFYCTKLITESDALKKVFRVSEEAETSGESNSSGELRLTTT
jgi:hypothetical protein